MKIGYCGPFCDTNFGDYAMLINDIYEIDESDVVLFSVSFENIDIILERYLKEYNVKKCIYGHLHGESLNTEVIEGNIRRNRNRTCKFRLFRL